MSFDRSAGLYRNVYILGITSFMELAYSRKGEAIRRMGGESGEQEALGNRSWHCGLMADLVVAELT